MNGSCGVLEFFLVLTMALVAARDIVAVLRSMTGRLLMAVCMVVPMRSLQHGGVIERPT